MVVIRMERYRLPVPIQTYSMKASKISIYYPQVLLPNPIFQHSINAAILHKVFAMFAGVDELGYYEPGVTELIGNYEMKNNQRGIISFTFTLFANMPSLAHPVDMMDSLTADVQTGKIYPLQDLFVPASNYKDKINACIKKQIKERNIPLLGEFPGISDDQTYYLADKTLIIYFDEYEITPGYVGFPMFPIPSYILEDDIASESPLQILMSN